MNVVVYSKDNCAYCVSAKSLLIAKNIPYIERKLNEDFTREWLLENYSAAKSFPVIVVDGFYIGGYNKLTEYLVNNLTESRKLLNEEK